LTKTAPARICRLTQHPIAVLAEHARDEAERGAVGGPHRLILVGERCQRDDRTEDLLGGYPHVGSDVGQYGRRDIEPVRQPGIGGQWRLGGDARALGYPDVEVIQHSLLLRGGYQRADLCGGVGAVAHSQPAHRGGQLCRELRKDVVLEQDS
jgi:hypothetical protein